MYFFASFVAYVICLLFSVLFDINFCMRVMIGQTTTNYSNSTPVNLVVSSCSFFLFCLATQISPTLDVATV